MENILGVEFRVPIDSGYFYRGILNISYFNLV